MPETTNSQPHEQAEHSADGANTTFKLALNNLTLLATQLCQTPVALIVANDHCTILSQVAWSATSCPIAMHFCHYTLLKPYLFWIRDMLADPRFAADAGVNGDQAIRFYAGVPLFDEDAQHLGTLCVMDYEPRTLEPAQQNMLEALGRQVCLQLQMEQAWRRLSSRAIAAPPVQTIAQQTLKHDEPFGDTRHQRHHSLELLHQINYALQNCSSLPEAHRLLAQQIHLLFPETAGGLFWLNPDEQKLKAIATWGHSDLLSQKQFSPGDCWALRRRQVHCAHSQSHPCPHVDQSSSAPSYCVPMLAKGQVVGLLYLNRLNLDPFPAAQTTLAITVAEQIALTLENLRLIETLQHHATQDPLTGLFNRRYMSEMLDQVLQRAHHGHYGVSLIMLDLDHFKTLNDMFGHQAGDTVLRDFSVFLKGFIRGTDVACRYGGEEFMLILPGTCLDIAYRRAEKIRRGLKYLKMQHGDQPLTALTVSAGVAAFPQQGNTAESLIKAADVALYQAKTRGRDRVVLAQPTLARK